MKMSFNEFLGNKTEGRTRDGVKRFIRSLLALAGITEKNWGANISANNVAREEVPLEIRKDTPTGIDLTVILNKRLCSIKLTCTKKAEVAAVLQALRTGTLKDGVFLLDKETPAPTEEVAGLPKGGIRIEKVVQEEVTRNPASDDSSDESSTKKKKDSFRFDTDHVALAFLEIWENVGDDKKRTFSKGDAMDWMMQSFNITTRLLAGRVIQAMIACGVIEKVRHTLTIVRFTELGRALGGNGAEGFPTIEIQRRTRKKSDDEQVIVEDPSTNEQLSELELAFQSLSAEDATTARELRDTCQQMNRLAWHFITLRGRLRQSLDDEADEILALITTP